MPWPASTPRDRGVLLTTGSRHWRRSPQSISGLGWAHREDEDTRECVGCCGLRLSFWMVPKQFNIEAGLRQGGGDKGTCGKEALLSSLRNVFRQVYSAHLPTLQLKLLRLSTTPLLACQCRDRCPLHRSCSGSWQYLREALVFGALLPRVHVQWLASPRTDPLREDSSGASESRDEVEACFKEVHSEDPHEAYCADPARTRESDWRLQWLDTTLGDLVKHCIARRISKKT